MLLEKSTQGLGGVFTAAHISRACLKVVPPKERDAITKVEFHYAVLTGVWTDSSELDEP